jgi:hypothetical protein
VKSRVIRSSDVSNTRSVPTYSISCDGAKGRATEVKKGKAINGMLFLFQVLYKMLSIAETGDERTGME